MLFIPGYVNITVQPISLCFAVDEQMYCDNLCVYILLHVDSLIC